MHSETSLRGKVAWVTGSSRGIGRVVADHLASLGARVVVHGTSLYSTRAFGEADSLNDVAHAIGEANHTEVLPVCGDLCMSLRYLTRHRVRAAAHPEFLPTRRKGVE